MLGKLATRWTAARPAMTLSAVPGETGPCRLRLVNGHITVRVGHRSPLVTGRMVACGLQIRPAVATPSIRQQVAPLTALSPERQIPTW